MTFSLFVLFLQFLYRIISAVILTIVTITKKIRAVQPGSEEPDFFSKRNPSRVLCMMHPSLSDPVRTADSGYWSLPPEPTPHSLRIFRAMREHKNPYLGRMIPLKLPFINPISLHISGRNPRRTEHHDRSGGILRTVAFFILIQKIPDGIFPLRGSSGVACILIVLSQKCLNHPGLFLMETTCSSSGNFFVSFFFKSPGTFKYWLLTY